MIQSLWVGETLRSLRVRLGWTQHELARRAGISQSMVSAIEAGRCPGLPLRTAKRLFEAMGARMVLSVDAPFLGDRERQLEPAHARCTAHVAARLRGQGWSVATEVEVGGDRSRGWIDVLACHPTSGALLVVEIKTEIRDVGAIERALGWYEREGPISARRFGWRSRRVTGSLLLLATAANDERAASNRASFEQGFPTRARDLASLVTGGAVSAPLGRGLAMIDPRSRRRDWLRPLRIDGRRSPAPYPDYAGFTRAIEPRPRPRSSVSSIDSRVAALRCGSCRDV